MFEAEDRATILKRTRGYYEDEKGTEASSLEGTFVFDSLSSNAKEFEKSYVEMDLMMDAVFIQTSWGKYLDMLAGELAGIDRRQATQASVMLTITGTAGIRVPKDSTFSTASGTIFATNADATIGTDGTVDVKATAAATGSGGNVKAGTITLIPMPIYGVKSVTNAADAYDGYEEESDDTLRDRALFIIQEPATSGNVNDYVEWASSVSGVGHVKVTPIWNGAGTVRVLITDTNGEPASADLIQKVTEKIESVRPIGASVTVATPSLFALIVKLTVTSGTGKADYIKSMLNKYYVSRNFSGNKVSYAKIGNMILSDTGTGVDDYSNLLVNDGTADIGITDEQIPYVTEVVLS